MNSLKIEIINIAKNFGRRKIFNGINFTFSGNNPFGISGQNGAGKSTLMKILANVLSQSEGDVNYFVNENKIEKENVFHHIGFVAPYLIFYNEFSPLENLRFFSQVRGKNFNENLAKELLSQFGIYKRRNDYLIGFSSGMLQRMKFVFAFYFEPDFLLFDEPTSYLDNKGKDIVYEAIENIKKEKLTIIASNEKNDLDLCTRIIDIENFKKKK